MEVEIVIMDLQKLFYEFGEIEYFTTDKYEVETEIKINADEKSFVSLMVLEGQGSAICQENQVDFKSGESIFIPANSGEVVVKGKCLFIKTTI